jgi:hypothetical protein
MKAGDAVTGVVISIAATLSGTAWDALMALPLVFLKALGAAPDEWPATSVVHELPATVLDVAIARAERSTWRRDSRTSNATDHRAHGATDRRAGNDASCRSCTLLRRLAGRGSETNQDCKDTLAHGDLLRN